MKTWGVFFWDFRIFWILKRTTSESSITRNQKNENSENSRARNKGYFHWLKTADDDIFVIRYSNYSKPTGNLLTKFEISTKSAKPSSFWGRRFWSLQNLPFFREMPKRICSRCLRSLPKIEETEKCTTHAWWFRLKRHMALVQSDSSSQQNSQALPVTPTAVVLVLWLSNLLSLSL